MGRSVAAESPAAAALLAGLDPGLHDTAHAQPALVATALGAALALQGRGARPDVVAGHSVGELAAWSIAGGAEPADAVRLARARGEAMQAVGAASPGRMWALHEAPATLPDDLVLAVDNVDHVVLSGPGAPPPGARPVPTSGAWHRPAMQPAAAPFAAALAALPARALRCPIASNHDGRITDDDAVVRAHLVAQLTAPVRFVAVLETLRDLGCTDVVVLGPGRFLAAQLARFESRWRVHRTDRAVDVQATAAALPERP